jgi:protein-serine/threonine kinase
MHRPSLEEKLLGKKNVLKICDFGVSLIMNSTQKKALMNERSGTFGYIAPEIKYEDSLIGPEIDVWAFGVVLYEMCTAYKPI